MTANPRAVDSTPAALRATVYRRQRVDVVRARSLCSANDESHRGILAESSTLDALGVRAPDRAGRVPLRRATGAARRAARRPGEPEGSRHAGTIRRVMAVLRRALGDAWQVDSQLPIALDDSSEPEPDISVVPYDSGAYLEAHPSRAVLIVEISESSYRIDREHKASLYARAGIADHWIVDAVRGAVEVHRDPVAAPDALYGSTYRSVVTLRPPAMVALLVEPARSIPVAALLP